MNLKSVARPVKSKALLLLAPLLILLVVSACTTSEDKGAFEHDSTWAMLPFKKLNEANPILKASDGVFICPILKQEVKWEEKDVFNPAAVVRNGAVYLFLPC